MDLSDLKDYGPVVVVVGMFLAFLWKFGNKALDAVRDFTKVVERLSTMIEHESEESKEQTLMLREMRDQHADPSSMFSTHGMREQITDVGIKVDRYAVQTNGKLDLLLNRPDA